MWINLENIFAIIWHPFSYVVDRVVDSFEKRGLKPMQEMLDATGGWPILMSDKVWNAKNYTWQQVDNEYFKLYSFSILFDISYQTDYENAGILMVYLFIYK